MLTMWLKYEKKDKIKFLLIKTIIFISIIGMFFLSAHHNKLTLPKMENKLSWYGGAILIIILFALVMMNRIKILFKIRSIGFLYLFLAFALLQPYIHVVVTTLGLALIPMLVDDIIVNGYFYILNVNKYWQYYKDVIASERK